MEVIYLKKKTDIGIAENNTFIIDDQAREIKKLNQKIEEQKITIEDFEAISLMK